MPRDLIIRGNTRQELLQWADRNGILRDTVDDEGNPIKVLRNGFYETPWLGTGKLMREPSTLRTTQAVDIVQGSEFGFDLPGATTPAWLTASVVQAVDSAGALEATGTYDRIQGPYAVFTTNTGQTTPQVGDTFDILSEPTYVSGYFILFRFGNNRLGAWQTLKDLVLAENDQFTFDGIRAYRWDGVEFAFADDVLAQAAVWGTPLHEWAGGNTFDNLQEEVVT